MEKKQYCHECGKLIFDGEEWLKTAWLVESGENPYVCEDCWPEGEVSHD